jgi:hypothetical protein
VAKEEWGLGREEGWRDRRGRWEGMVKGEEGGGRVRVKGEWEGGERKVKGEEEWERRKVKKG